MKIATTVLILFLNVTAAQGATPTPTAGCTNDTWTATSITNVPIGRENHTAVWTGDEMIAWGGYFFDGNAHFLNTGGRYNPGTDSWTATNTTGGPSARNTHTAVWTGNEMIVWGGNAGAGAFHNTGGRYHPSTDTWITTSITSAPIARNLHTAIWTGSEMIVWGGTDGSGTVNGWLNTGGKYNAELDSWTATSTINSPAGRSVHTAVWTGNEMIVWGGFNATGQLNTGGSYHPSTNSWTATGTTNAPSNRRLHTAVWTGSQMIVWGGDNNGVMMNTGGKYDPATDSWTATSTANAPTARYYHTAVWTGSEMIVWGGYAGGGASGYLNTGGRYDPVTDTWTPLGTFNAPTSRSNPKAVWTDTQMTVWGGYPGGGSDYPNSGGKYCAQLPAPPTPAPTGTPTPSPIPSPMATPTATPIPSVNISGNIFYCSSPSFGPISNVTLSVTGDTTTSTLSDGAGNYQFSSLLSGGTYTGTPSAMARTPASAGINTVDVIATQRDFLHLTPLTGCRLMAADVNDDASVNTVDVIAIQRFFLGASTGIANVGTYRFNPASRSYSAVSGDQTGQDYDGLVLGDVAASFIH